MRYSVYHFPVRFRHFLIVLFLVQWTDILLICAAGRCRLEFLLNEYKTHIYESERKIHFSLSHPITPYCACFFVFFCNFGVLCLITLVSRDFTNDSNP